jgi:hypothetical protein
MSPGRQAGGAHGLAHRSAVGVALLQPGGVEGAGQRAAAQEARGLVALAFLLGEGDHLDAVFQPPAGAVQRAHRGHRHQDAQAAVVLAAVAHGVVVAAGEQARALAAVVAAVVDADDVADGVDCTSSKPHSSRIQCASCAAQARCASVR